jgi:2-enoate reductase
MNSTSYVKLFEPIKIAGLQLPNRIAMAPMGIGVLSDGAGFSPRAIDYYVERARGGTGLIITGLNRVDDTVENFLSHFHENMNENPSKFVSTAARLTEEVHHYNSRIFIQLTAGFGRSAPGFGMNFQPVGPSAIPYFWNPSIICREMRTNEVEKIVASFAKAADVCLRAGFDGIEIHAVHEGYLLDQFAIALFNHRTDKYGGDLKGRLTFASEIVQAIKSRTGSQFPVVLRFSVKSYIKDWVKGGLPGEDFKELGRDTEEGLEAAKILEKAGYDAFDADAGSYDAWYWAHPPLYQEHGLYLPLTEQLKKAVHVPVIVAGRMEIPELAVKALEKKQADIISLGRGLLAEPAWPRKVRTGKIEEVRPCLGCHDGCFMRMGSALPISCTVNPACGRESSWGLTPTMKSQKILVAGGGAAGLEAARVAAIRGHRVVLYEQGNQLGGHLIAASRPVFKNDDRRLLEWYLKQLRDLPVEIKTGIKVTPAIIKAERPQAVIIATGSTSIIPEIPGLDDPRVATAVQVLLGEKKTGEQIVVIGGGLVGCETALHLAQQGKKVTIVEMRDKLLFGGLPIHYTNRTMLLDLLQFHKVETAVSLTVTEVREKGVTAADKDSRCTTFPADNIVLAVGLRSNQELYRSIKAIAIPVYLVGDAQKPRKVLNAIWDAYEVARNI